MRYYELTITITPNSEAAGDILAALLADAGCETFVPTDSGQKAYIQQSLFEAAAIEEALTALASYLPGTTATYTRTEAPDENWNATWESEHHFEPIPLPDGQQIQIIPRQAFGSGEHATTRLMLRLLATAGTKTPSAAETSPTAPSSAETSPTTPSAAETSPTTLSAAETSPTALSSACASYKMVIDAGCGTGVLGIAAMKLGAQLVMAYDIDGWSVRNALENFALNGLTATQVSSFDPTTPSDSPHCLLAEGDPALPSNSPHCLLAEGDPALPTDSPHCLLSDGDASALSAAPLADLLMANINRNILLSDLPSFAAHLRTGGRLLLSGFFEEDIAPLTARATPLGLHLIRTSADGDWRALEFRKLG